MQGTSINNVISEDDVLMKDMFLTLPQPKDTVQCQYVWIDGSLRNLRTKSQTLSKVPQIIQGKRNQRNKKVLKHDFCQRFIISGVITGSGIRSKTKFWTSAETMLMGLLTELQSLLHDYSHNLTRLIFCNRVVRDKDRLKSIA